jgi:hypothetical protein
MKPGLTDQDNRQAEKRTVSIGRPATARLALPGEQRCWSGSRYRLLQMPQVSRAAINDQNVP